MALSISKSQRNLLVKAWLDKIGTDKGSIRTVKLTHIEKTLYDLAAHFKLMAENNLSVQDAVNTGKLADSIQWEEVEFFGGKYSVAIKVLDYYKFIDEGVRGVESGSGKYAFKHKYPSKKMMIAIKHWLIREGLKARTRESKKNPLGQEKKAWRKTLRGMAKARKKKTLNLEAVAWGMATNIKKKGIKATNFFTGAGKQLDKEMAEKAGEAFEIMIINEIIR